MNKLTEEELAALPDWARGTPGELLTVLLVGHLQHNWAHELLENKRLREELQAALKAKGVAQTCLAGAMMALSERTGEHAGEDEGNEPPCSAEACCSAKWHFATKHETKGEE